MRIRINTDINAPGCPCEIEGLDEEKQVRAILVDSDWGYPGYASAFGWSTRDVQVDKERQCDHDSTDGTVDCKECGCKVGAFLESAYDFLASNDGLEADDPGYFS